MPDNWAGAQTGKAKVWRGGAWSYHYGYASRTFHNGSAPMNADRVHGLRLASRL